VQVSLTSRSPTRSTLSRALAERRARGNSAPSATQFERTSRLEPDGSRGVSDCCTPKGYRQIFSEKNAGAEARRYRRKGLDGTSRRIFEFIKKRGVEGKTLLEVGGGIGAIEIELLKAGMAQAVNVELTPTYEAAAGELLGESGLADRVERRVMDFAEAGTEVETADVVVMNRVICCYPDMPKLAGAAAERARDVLVMSFPNDRWWTRLGLTLANFGFRVIRMQFRVFLHSPELILAAVEQHGFKTRLSERGLLWQVTALERTQPTA
jgi:2-polyprenyl-3-methyl-5-hydroxy-6-metoxy-1,4-benzoquinol methylase